MINARAFLGKEGFVFGKSPAQIDRLFLKQFSSDETARIQGIWQTMHIEGASPAALYGVPKTSKQANILWSLDRARYVASFDWLAAEVGHWQPISIVEMGCGSGNLLRFLSANFPEIRLKGIDAERSLVAISKAASNIDVVAFDYLDAAPAKPDFDVIICNFGFDLARFEPSTTPHSIERIGQSQICPRCSNDFSAQFSGYMKSWRAWGNESAKLFLFGRLPNFGYTRGVIIAAAENGWRLDLDRSRYLKVREPDGSMQRFPAMVFTAAEVDGLDELLRDAEKLFRII